MAGLPIRIADVALFTREMRFTRAFRFGVATVTAAPQAFVRVAVEATDGRRAHGVAAEMMMPKWFDKNPAKSPEDTISDLRASLLHAADLYRQVGTERRCAFAQHAAVYLAQMAWAASVGLPALVGGYGSAVTDRAILDGALRLAGLDLARGLQANLPGLDARLTPDLDDRTIAAFLAGLSPLDKVSLRHTIGLADAVEGEGGLEGLLRRTPLAFFKIKLGGDVTADVARLREILPLLERHAPDFRASLDANEGYDVDGLADLAAALSGRPELAPLRERLICIEQPLDRVATLDAPLGEIAKTLPVIIDEADGSYDAFPKAAALGYRGVSAKGCKGLYKALLNAARAASWNAAGDRPGRFFLTAEDLTCQAGLGVQQDTAFAACLGLPHAERNGHHYVDGFGPAPAAEAEAFRAAHPAFYAAFPGTQRGAGALPAASLFATPGFAAGAEPDWRAMTPLTAYPSQEIAS